MTDFALITEEQKTKWIAALRSGEYKQGQLSLKEERDGIVCHCCLGVLAEIIDPNLFSSRDEYDGRVDYEWDGFACTLPNEILPDDDQNQLMYMNDTLGYDFNQIADAIEFGTIHEHRDPNS